MLSGSYGVVTLSEEFAIKRTKLFDRNRLVSANLNEAVLLSSKLALKNSVVCYDVDISPHGNELYLKLERGEEDLTSFLQRTSLEVRVQQFEPLLRDIVVGLQHLHTHGIVHGDLKPSNIIVSNGTPVFKLIDFGGIRMFRQFNLEVEMCCTYPFLAPEAFDDYVLPAPALDAWSLGVVLFCYLCATFPVQTNSSENHNDKTFYKNFYKCNVLDLSPLDKPGIPEAYRATVCALLISDPAKRLCVHDLYTALTSDDAPCARTIEGDMDVLDVHGRDRWIDKIFVICTQNHLISAFPLACSIADRYRALTATAYDAAIIKAVVCIAASLVYGTDMHLDAHIKKHIRRVCTALKFSLMTDTCDYILSCKHRNLVIDWAVLCMCIKSRMNTLDMVSEYERREVL